MVLNMATVLIIYKRHRKDKTLLKRKGQKNNKSGYRGVCWSSRAEKYRATIGIDGKQIHLGYFDTPEEASKAYHQKAKETFGDFYNPLVK
ncbi:putative homing endonuclease [Klebsiella phage CPRSA]|nr:putative homing endonuclease [Klebsiella phage CPRSA]